MAKADEAGPDLLAAAFALIGDEGWRGTLVNGEERIADLPATVAGGVLRVHLAPSWRARRTSVTSRVLGSGDLGEAGWARC